MNSGKIRERFTLGSTEDGFQTIFIHSPAYRRLTLAEKAGQESKKSALLAGSWMCLPREVVDEEQG